MAFSFIQTTQNVTASGTTLAITPASPATANNLLVVNVKFGGAAATALTVTDNASVPNSYAVAAGPIDTGGTNSRSYQFYGVQVTGGATTITVNWTTASAARITVDEFSGGMLTNATVFDKASSGGNTTATSGSVTSFSPSAAGELIACGIGLATGGLFTAGTNYTTATNHTSQSTMYNLSSTTTETAPCSWVNSVVWLEIAGAYKPFGSSPVSVINGGGNSRTASLGIGNIARL